MSIQIVCCWRTIFQEGRKSEHDEEQNAQPATSREHDVIDAVCMVIGTDKLMRLDDFLTKLKKLLKLACHHYIITENLQLTKLFARWMPWLLSDFFL